MRSILFLSLMNGSAWGGSEEYWFRMALWMSKHHYRVEVCCYEWEEKQGRISQLKAGGISVYLFPNKRGGFQNWLVKRVLNDIPFSSYDLVFVNQGGWEEILHAPFRNLYKKLPAYIIANHNYNENASLTNARQKLLEQWISGAIMNVAAAHKIFEIIETRFNIPIARKSILLNPVTFDPPKQVTAFPALQKESYTWIMLAELDIARKAQDILIKTLSLEKWKKRNWKLHLYGKGKDAKMLEAIIKSCGLEQQVYLKGFTNDIKAALTGCHLYFQCTRIDAMPLGVVEAMAMSRPCFVSQVGDMPSWIKDGVEGFVCSKLTEEAIDQKLEQCWTERENWQKMGERAFQQFLGKYPVPYEEKMAAQLESYLENNYPV